MFCTFFGFKLDKDIVVMKVGKHRRTRMEITINNEEVQWIIKPHVEASWSRKKQPPKGTTGNPTSGTYTLKERRDRFKTHKGIRRK